MKEQVLQWLPLLGMIVAVWLAFDARRHAKNQTQADSISDLKIGLAVLEARFEDFLQVPIRRASRKLTNHDTPTLDVLLRKFEEDRLKDESEVYHLKVLLQEIVDRDPDQDRREQAEDLLLLIRNKFEMGKDLLAALQRKDENIHAALTGFSKRYQK